MEKPALAFLGLGRMGVPMALRLLAAGYRVHVWNRNRAKLAPALEKGASEAATPREAARAAEITLVCVTDTKAVEDVAFGADGVAAVEGRGKILVDHSSIDPDATRTFAERLASRSGMQWADAPVSGGVGGAQAGQLTIMCGGHAEAIDRVRPVVGAYANNVTRMGPAGTGPGTKLCNQIIVGCTCVIAGGDAAPNSARREACRKARRQLCRLRPLRIWAAAWNGYDTGWSPRTSC
jgi:3-hydroxyisobutyrate dehydrogenase